MNIYRSKPIDWIPNEFVRKFTVKDLFKIKDKIIKLPQAIICELCMDENFQNLHKFELINNKICYNIAGFIIEVI